jgi:PAS domain S-box-containing protein
MGDAPLDTDDTRALATAYLSFGTVSILGGELVFSTVLGTSMASPLTIVKGLLFVVVSSGFVALLVERKNQRIDRQRASVQTSLQKLERVVSASPIPIIGVNPDREVTRWNEAATETFGWTRDEVLGESLPTVTNERRADVERILQRTVNEDGLSNVDVVRQRRDGSDREFRLSTAPIRDTDGELTEVVGVFVDTTEQKRRERRLREFEMAVEQAGHAIYLTTPSGEITYVNPAFENVTGYSRDEALGETPDILNSGEMGESYYDSLWATVESGATWQERIVDRRKNGELVGNSLEHGGDTVNVELYRSSSDDSRLVVRVSDDGPGLPDNEWKAIERG